VTVVDTKGKLRFLLVKVAGNDNQQIISLGPKVTHDAFAMPTFFQVTANASGDVLIAVDALCAKGPPLTAFVNILFN
jgi:hypothetical protein